MNCFFFYFEQWSNKCTAQNYFLTVLRTPPNGAGFLGPDRTRVVPLPRGRWLSVNSAAHVNQFAPLKGFLQPDAEVFIKGGGPAFVVFGQGIVFFIERVVIKIADILQPERALEQQQIIIDCCAEFAADGGSARCKAAPARRSVHGTAPASLQTPSGPALPAAR